MSSPRAVLGSIVASLLACVGCSAELGDDVAPGFASASADVCDTRTSSVALTTANGGRLSLDVHDACGRSLGSCRGVDVYAAQARGSVRLAGGMVFLDDCIISVSPGATLIASFTRDDASTPSERYQLALTGTCRADGGVADAGTSACPRDAGPSSSTDASTPRPDAASVVDGGP